MARGAPDVDERLLATAYVPLEDFDRAAATAALAMAVVVWLLLWRTRLGYQIRAFGKSEKASRYAGINPVRITMISMLISGGLAGMMAPPGGGS